MLTLDQGVEVLSDELSSGRLIAFVGSGISVDSGLPTWDGFLDSFIVFCRDVKNEYGKGSADAIEGILPDTLLANAELERSKRPAHVALVLKDALMRAPDNLRSNIQRDFQKWFYRSFDRAEPNEKHHQIVSTNYPYILTSNYDLLLEQAQKPIGAPYSTLSLLSEKERVASAFYLRQPAIIHVHGTYEDALFDKIVFTARDYIEVVKKRYPGSSFLLQSLFLNYSTVFFGYGASDPHLEDLMEELSYYLDFKADANLPKNYLVVRKDKVAQGGVYEKFKSYIRTELIAIETLQDYNTLLWKLKSFAPRPSPKPTT